MSVSSQKNAYDALVKMGVNVKFNSHVTDYENDTVTLDNGDPIKTKTFIWAAGVMPKIIAGIPKESYGKGNR